MAVAVVCMLVVKGEEMVMGRACLFRAVTLSTSFSRSCVVCTWVCKFLKAERCFLSDGSGHRESYF